MWPFKEKMSGMEIIKSKMIYPGGNYRKITVISDKDIGLSARDDNTGELVLCSPQGSAIFKKISKQLKNGGYFVGSIKNIKDSDGALEAISCPFYEPEFNLTEQPKEHIDEVKSESV